MSLIKPAITDAKLAQDLFLQQCAAAGKTPPPYVLRELIGKGSFGRVYKANASEKAQQVVAVKIISIEDGDTPDPRQADTIGDILKEVGALKLLSHSGAKNINTIIDTFVLGHSVWIVTEYAIGSVATLMKPTGYLSEKWVIPILREAAEALFWVHKHGIIHRDIKCANILVTEAGAVQLCDFGVAGVLETKFDKRKTVIGTLHWMAPELFDHEVRYGSEIDIWAFGAMAYELASGGPPNARRQINQEFGAYLRRNCPRLDGDQYSDELKDLVAFCMVEDPQERPTIEQVQKHPYILDTADAFPTKSLLSLLSAYKLWASHGGVRQSLFSGAGAQGGIGQASSLVDHWNFYDDKGEESEPEPDLQHGGSQLSAGEVQTVRDAYGVELASTPTSNQAHRRRLPPKALKTQAPLEKLFDPNTLSNYRDIARAFYGTADATLGPLSDLPLRDGLDTQRIRESLIDLDEALGEDGPSYPGDMETIKPRPRSSGYEEMSHRKTIEWTFPKPTPSSAGIDPGNQSHRRTLEWTFADAVSSPRHIGNPNSEVDDPFAPGSPAASGNRVSTASLIDLDAGLVSGSSVRPSTAYSGYTSASSDDDAESNAFGLDVEKYPQVLASSSQPISASDFREPSIYVTDENVARDLQGSISPSAWPPREPSASHDAAAKPGGGESVQGGTQAGSVGILRVPAPMPPSRGAMEGTASPDEVKEDLRRLLASFSGHLAETSRLLENQYG